MNSLLRILFLIKIKGIKNIKFISNIIQELIQDFDLIINRVDKIINKKNQILFKFI